MSRTILESKHVSETISEVFDFLSRLSVGETISSASVSATVYSGQDASPSAILSGPVSISAAKVTQKVRNGVVGVTYRLVCTANTSLLQALQIVGYLVVTPDSE